MNPSLLHRWYLPADTLPGGTVPRPIAVLTAMEQEGHLIEARLDDPREEVSFGRRYVSGHLADSPIVTAISGFGKAATVAAAAAFPNPDMAVTIGLSARSPLT